MKVDTVLLNADWTKQTPDTMEHLRKATESRLVEHQPGGHDQKKHGRRGGGSARPKIVAWAEKRFDNPEHAKAFVEWFGDSKAVDENGEPLVIYRGDNRADLIQGVFKVDDAEGSGGLYFTDNPEVASSYATGKDFMGNDAYEDWANSFLVDGNPINKTRFSPDDRKRIQDALLSYEIDEGGGPALGRRTLDDYKKRSRTFGQAIFDVSVSSGLMDAEEFEGILKDNGINAMWDDPRLPHPGVSAVYARIANPLTHGNPVISDIMEEIPNDVTAKLLTEGETVSFVTPEFRAAAESRGFDGIVDKTGGTITRGESHTVYIVWDSLGIKSAIGNDGTFGLDNPNISESRLVEHGEHDQKGHGNWARGIASKGSKKKTGDYALDDDVPVEPGTAPIPEGHIRFFHYSNIRGDQPGNIDWETIVHNRAVSLRDNGIKMTGARGEQYGEPNQIWASRKAPESIEKIYVEFSLPHDDPRIGGTIRRREGSIEEIQNATTDATFTGDIKPDEIVAVHEPWHEHARYLIEKEGGLDRVGKGEFDHFLTRRSPDEVNYLAATVRRAKMVYDERQITESRLQEHQPGGHDQKKHGRRGGKDNRDGGKKLTTIELINKALGEHESEKQEAAKLMQAALDDADMGAARKILTDEGWMEETESDEDAMSYIQGAVEDEELFGKLQGTKDAKLDADGLAKLYIASEEDSGFGDGILYGFAIHKDKIKDELGEYLGAQERQGYNINGQPLGAGEPTLYDGGNYEPEAEPDIDEFVRNQFPTTDWIDGGTGYVLHDGKGVDMSHGSGVRADDHRSAIPSGSAMRRWGWHEDAIVNRSVAMNQTMQKARAIRVHVGRGDLYLDMMHRPSRSQWRAIQQHIDDYDITDLRFDAQSELRGETIGGEARSFGELRTVVDNAFEKLVGGSVTESRATRVPRFASVQEHQPGGHDQKKHGRRGGGGKKDPGKQTKTPEFKKWFGDSKVVDENGEPLVVYHGTDRDFKTFDRAGSRATGDTGYSGRGYYFGDSDHARWYAGKGTGANVMPVFLAMENPLEIQEVERKKGGKDQIITVAERLGVPVKDGVDGMNFARLQPTLSDEITAALKGAGYDGVIYTWSNSNTIEYMVPDNKQIKSATGNKGAFDPDNPNITESRMLD